MWRCSSEFDDLSRADKRLERHRFDGRATVEEVVGGVDVGAGVGAEGERAEVGGVAVRERLVSAQFRAGLAAP